MRRYAEASARYAEAALKDERSRARAAAAAPASTPVSSTPGSAQHGAGAPAAGAEAALEENGKLKVELKERKRQMHKLQEVYARLKVWRREAQADPDLKAPPGFKNSISAISLIGKG